MARRVPYHLNRARWRRGSSCRIDSMHPCPRRSPMLSIRTMSDVTYGPREKRAPRELFRLFEGT